MLNLSLAATWLLFLESRVSVGDEHASRVNVDQDDFPVESSALSGLSARDQARANSRGQTVSRHSSQRSAKLVGVSPTSSSSRSSTSRNRPSRLSTLSESSIHISSS